MVSLSTMDSISYKNIWRIAYPIMAGSVAQNIVNVVDTAFMGRLGPTALGAAGNSIIFYFMFIVMGLGFSIGAEIIVGRRNGEGRYKEVGHIVDHCFYFLIPMSILIFTLLKLFSHQVMSMVTSDQDILAGSLEFFDVRIYGIFFAFLNMAFRTFYVGTMKTGVLIWSTLTMAVVNTLLDYVLIFGKAGFPEMGIAGAALASVIAEGSATAFFIIYTHTKVDRKKYSLLQFRPWSNPVANGIFRTASPVVIQQFSSVCSWMVFFLIVEKVGSEELAVSHIVRSIYMVLMIPLFGFAAATGSLVSNLIGMGAVNQVFLLIRRIIALNLLITTLIIGVNIAIPETILSFFTDNTSLISFAIPVLFVV